MKRQNYSSASPFEKTIGFSRAVRAGNMLFISGTAPVGENGYTVHPGDAYKQTMRCLEIMKKAILNAGGKWEHVVRTRVYLKHAGDWKEAARAHSDMLSEIAPACTFLQVQGFIDPEWLVETEADCCL